METDNESSVAQQFRAMSVERFQEVFPRDLTPAAQQVYYAEKARRAHQLPAQPSSTNESLPTDSVPADPSPAVADLLPRLPVGTRLTFFAQATIYFIINCLITLFVIIAILNMIAASEGIGWRWDVIAHLGSNLGDRVLMTFAGIVAFGVFPSARRTYRNRVLMESAKLMETRSQKEGENWSDPFSIRKQ